MALSTADKLQQTAPLLFYISIILYFPIIDNTIVDIRYYAQNLFKGKIWPSLNQCGADILSLGYQSLQGPAVSGLCCLSFLPSCSHAHPHIPAILGFFQFVEWTLAPSHAVPSP